MSPDKVCEKFSQKGIEIKINVKSGTVFIEGTTDALEFLAELFLAQAHFDKDEGFQIFPSGAGKIFFSRDSTHGLYIHRVVNDN